MSDLSLGTFGFDVNTTGLRAGSDELIRLETRINAATTALERMEARAASAMSRAPAALGSTMGGMAGPSPMGGSQAATGLQAAAQGYAGLTAAAQAATAATAAYGHAATASIPGIAAATAGHKAHGAAMGNSTLAALELAHVSRALFDDWAAGGNVMRGLLMEGGRIQLMLSSGGGLAGLFGLVTTKVGDLATKALGLANPFTLGTAAVVGFGAASFTALSHVRSLREEMDRALSGVGHFSGLSPTGLEALARRAADANGLSLTDARSAAEAMARTGRIDASGISGGLADIRGYASAFGTSYSQAGDKLADIFANPVQGADKLNERLGFLDARTRTYIATLQAQGDAQAAAAALQTAAAPSLAEQVKQQSTWERFSGWWSTRNDEVEHAIARSFGNLNPAERLAAAERDAENRRLVGASSYDPGDDPLNLSEDMRRSSQLRAMQQRDIDTRRSSLEVDSVIGRIDPDAARYRDLVNQRKLLGDAIANPDVTSKLPDGMSSSGKLVSGADLLADSLGKVNDRLANWMSSVEKSTLAVNANVMGINAWTLGEHLAAATAQEMASLGIRQIRTSEELVAVQAKQAEIIARANDKAYNLARDSEDALSTAGLFGLDKQRAEIHNRYRDYRDQLSDTSVGADFGGIGAAFLPARSAVSDFSGALGEATQRLAAFPAGASAAPLSGPYGGLKPFATNAANVPLSGGFDSSVNRTLGFEGGLLEHDTNGTPSNFGINAASHPGIDVRHLTRDQAKDIYRREYWNPLGLDQQGPAMQRVSFDTAVMEGNDRAKRMMAQSGGDAGRMLDERQAYEASLIQKSPGKYGPFEKSWALRDANLRSDLGEPGSTILASAAATDHGALTIGGGGGGTSALGVKLDTKGNLAIGERNTLKAANVSAGEGIIHSADTALQGRSAAFDALTRSTSMSVAELAKYTEVSQLQLKLDQEHVTIGPKMRAEMEALGDKAAKLSDDEGRRRAEIAIADFGRSSVSDVLSSGTIAAAHGGSFGDAAKQSLGRIGDSLIQKGISGFLGQAFGSQGSPFGGFLGGLFGGAHATGGRISGPGTGTSDSIMARVSNGEYIVRADAASRYGGLLDRINDMSMPKFAGGGLVGAPAWAVPSGTADEAGMMMEGDF